MATSIPSNIASYPIKEQRYTLPWGQIAGKHWGNTDAPHHILALHGWLDNAGTFDALFPLLFENPTFSQMYSILALDLPGHGLSDHRGDGVHNYLVDNLLDVVRVINQLGWSRITLLGHSMGGSISAMLTATLKDRIEKLITIDVFTPFGVPHEEYIDNLQYILKNTSSYAKLSTPKIYPDMNAIIARIIEGNKDSKLSLESATLLSKRGSRKVDGGYVFTRDITLHSKTPLHILSSNHLDHIKVLSSLVKVPVLHFICNGWKQVVLNVIFEDAIKENGYSNIRTVQIPDTHHVHLNNPSKILPSLLEFLIKN